jgi:hypothetical protein
MLFNWIRKKAHEAMLAGVADAVADLTKGDADGYAPAIAQLRLTLEPALALPAPEPDAPARKRRGE